MSTSAIRSPDEFGPGAALRARASSLVLPFDAVLLLAVAGLCVCSILTIGYATGGSEPDVEGAPDYFVDRQLAYFVVGLVLAAVASRLDYSRLRELRIGVYVLLIASLLAVLLFGAVQRGSRLSIELGFINLQTSELGKVLLVVVLAGFLVDRARSLGARDTTSRAVLLGLVPTALVLTMDLGSGLVYLAIIVTVLFVAGTPARHFAALGALAAVAVTTALVVAPLAGVEVLKPYQKDRLTSFLNPSDTASKEAYQQIQSRIAIGAGEKTGRGDAATQTQYDFLPEHHTDFVFAVVGERWGFAGAALVLSLYALVVWRGLRILTSAKNLYGALIAGGVVAMVLFQVFVNVGMNLGIMPITGIPLPLMSYGGSSVLTTFLAIGLLQSVYAQGRVAARGKRRLLGA